MQHLELWGGHECTLNRVGDSLSDQTVLSGHEQRIEDLDLFAGLGLSALRYPMLWERVAPKSLDRCDWSWTDSRFARIRDLGMRPIAGLLHHGSGPSHTSLVDPAFPELLGGYAAAAAARYDWIEDWTPVNEPLTTARFSTLYGMWYPHARDERSLWMAILNQVEGTIAAMQAIRAINPAARLIQTEDLGRAHATPEMAHLADYINERRWVTWDLLCGRVTRNHPLWERIAALGYAERLERIADAPCPPDVIGLNHYLTSDRFLDHRLDAYPEHVHSNAEADSYVDTEAVRVLEPASSGLAAAIDEATRRYDIPLAITEVHNGCTREEQARWMVEAWETAEAMRAAGRKVIAVTAWSLLGSFDWNSLLTRRVGHYETGVYDVRAGKPQPTALVPILTSLARGERPDHPMLDGMGWWRRDIRLRHTPFPGSATEALPTPAPRTTARRRPLLITGATGTLGQAIARACEVRGLDYVVTDRARLPIDDPDTARRRLDELKPWAVINAAGWVRVDDAEHDPEGCRRANTEGAIALARLCAERELPFAGFSSDLVFDGQLDRAYVESDATAPLNVYGSSKADADSALMAWDAPVLMVRTAAFFSNHDPYNFAAAVRATLSRGERFRAANDCAISPTYVPDLVGATLDLMIDGQTGLWHLANRGAITWSDFAYVVADALGLDRRMIEAVPSAELGWIAPRPLRVPLGTEKADIMPSFDDALARYAAIARAAA